MECECDQNDHTVRLTLDEVDGDVWLEVHLSKCDSIFKRAWNAIKYVFGLDVTYGHFDVTLIKEEDLTPIINLLTESKALREANK